MAIIQHRKVQNCKFHVGTYRKGRLQPVSDCVKCQEVAWEEGANAAVEVPVLKILAYTCTLPRPQSGGHAAFVEH